MDAKTSLKGRSFLTLKDFTPEEIGYFLDLAAKLKADKKKRDHRKQSKKGKISLFYLKNQVQEQDVHLRSDVLMRVHTQNI